LGNEVLLNAAYLFISFVLLKIRNILTGCYITPSFLLPTSSCPFYLHNILAWSSCRSNFVEKFLNLLHVSMECLAPRWNPHASLKLYSPSNNPTVSSASKINLCRLWISLTFFTNLCPSRSITFIKELSCLERGLALMLGLFSWNFNHP